jgi:hypothetical protein
MDNTLTCEPVSIWSIKFESAFLSSKSRLVVHKDSMPLRFTFIFVEIPLYLFFFHKLTLHVHARSRNVRPLATPPSVLALHAHSAGRELATPVVQPSAMASCARHLPCLWWPPARRALLRYADTYQNYRIGIVVRIGYADTPPIRYRWSIGK